MKGDLILLGVTGFAILVIPLAVSMRVVGMPNSPVSVMATVGESTSGSWQTTHIPGGYQDTAPTASAAPVVPETKPKKTPETKPKEQPPGTAYQATVESFRVLDRTTGKVSEISVGDYVRGAIAAEMPATFHEEALKAQGVAALTYAYYHHWEQADNPDPLLLGADFSADPAKREGYLTERMAKKFYGENWAYNWDKVTTAAAEAQKWVVLSQGEPIAAAYHAISAGSTEAAENIWGAPLPCLTTVDSSWDILAKGYKSSVTLSQSQLKEKLKDSGVTLLPNPDSWFAVEKTTPAGYVAQVQVGSQTMTGNQLRNLLGLRSSSFTIRQQGKDFLFLVVGYGHGAGLSQNGADYMARQGDSFTEILEHYYPGGVVARID